MVKERSHKQDGGNAISLFVLLTTSRSEQRFVALLLPLATSGCVDYAVPDVWDPEHLSGTETDLSNCFVIDGIFLFQIPNSIYVS